MSLRGFSFLLGINPADVRSFTTISVPFGTNPVAGSPSDTLSLTSSDGLLAITGTGSNTIDFTKGSGFNEIVDDRVAGLLVAGSGITLTYDDPSNTLTITGTALPSGLFTAGSVIFAGATGVLAQDNANFFWDDTDNNLGIGTIDPNVKLSVKQTDIADPTGFAASVVALFQGTNSAQICIASGATSGTGLSVLAFGEPDDYNVGAVEYSHITDTMSFRTGDSNRVSIAGATIFSVATTFAVFNSVATTINAFGAATTINIGASTGTLTVANTTLAAKAGTFSTTLLVTGNITNSALSASSLVATDGSKVLTSTVSGLSPTFTGLTLSGLTAGRVVFTGTAGLISADANLTYNGSAFGTTVPFTNTNATDSTSASTGAIITSGGIGVAKSVFVGGDVTIVGGDLICNTATTFNIINTVATTVNAFGAATTIAMGAATGTLTVANTTLAAKAGTFSTTLLVTGNITNSALSASALVATDGSKVLTSTVSGLSPTFTGLTLSGLTAGRVVYTGVGGLLSASANFTFNDSALGTTVPFTNTNATASTSSITGALIVTGGVGIGGALFTAGKISSTSLAGATTAQLLIQNSTSLGTTLNDTVLIYTTIGLVSNSFQNHRWMLRNTGSGTDWNTATLHDAISIDASFLTPRTNTRCYWERDAFNRTHVFGDSATNYISMAPTVVSIPLTTASTSITTGALTVAGGISCQLDHWSRSVNTQRTIASSLDTNTFSVTATATSGTIQNLLSTYTPTNVSGSSGTLIHYRATNNFASMTADLSAVNSFVTTLDTPPVSRTVTLTHGFRIGLARTGAGTTTSQIGMRLAFDGASAGAVGTAYGILVDGFTHATTNWSIAVDSGNSYFGPGNVRFGSGVVATNTVDITGTLGVTSTTTVGTQGGTNFGLLQVEGGSVYTGQGGTDLTADELMGMYGFFSTDASASARQISGGLAQYAEVNWTAVSTTWDSRLELQTILNGTVYTPVYILSSGHVGIGYATPAARLTVKLGADADPTGMAASVVALIQGTGNTQLCISTAGAGTLAVLAFGDPADYNIGAIEYDHSTDTMSLRVSDSNRFSFTSTAMTTSITTLALVNTTATTINFAGAATTLNLCAATCTTTMGGTLIVAKNQNGITTLGNARMLQLSDTVGNSNDRIEIGFGYKALSGNFSQPVVIGSQITNNAANTIANFYVSTRNTTADSFPTIRFTIDGPGDAAFTETVSFKGNSMGAATWVSEDFRGGIVGNGTLGQYGWNQSNFEGSESISYNTSLEDTVHTGIIELSTGGAVADAQEIVYLGTLGGGILLGGGELEYEALVYLPTLSTALQEYSVIIGYAGPNDPSGATFADFTNGVYFKYLRTTSVNWICVTANNATLTSTTTSTAVSAAAWVKLKCEINAAASSVTFYVNGTSVATHTTNIPTAAGRLILPMLSIRKTVGTTARVLDVDYFMSGQLFTTAR